MVPNVHAVKGLSRRWFIERRCFSHIFTSSVQHHPSTVKLSFPQPRSSYSAVCVQVQHTLLQTAVFAVTMKHQQATPGPLKHIFNITRLTKKDQPALSLHRHRMKAKDSNGGCWGLPAPSEMSSEQLGAQSPSSRQAAKPTYGWPAQRLGHALPRLVPGPACAGQLSGQTADTISKAATKGSSANRILVQLICYKLRESSDRRLGTRHRSPGKA